MEEQPKQPEHQSPEYEKSKEAELLTEHLEAAQERILRAQEKLTDAQSELTDALSDFNALTTRIEVEHMQVVSKPPEAPKELPDVDLI